MNRDPVRFTSPDKDVHRHNRRFSLDSYVALAWGLAVATIPLELFVRTPLGNINRLMIIGAVGLGVIKILRRFEVNQAPIWYSATLHYLAWMALSYVWSISHETTFQRVSFVGQFVVFPFVMLATTDRSLVPRIFSWTVVGTSALSALLTLGLFGVGPAAESIASTQSRGVVGDSDPNLLADHIAISLVVLISSQVGGIKLGIFSRWRVAAPIVFLHLIGLLATGSRGGALAFVMGLITLFFAAGRHDQRKATQRRRLVIAGIFATGLVLTTLAAGSPLLGRLERALDQGSEDSTIAWRLATWEYAWDIYTEHPIVGTGFGTYPVNRELEFGEPAGAHSALFGTLSDLGTIGLVLLCLLAFGSLKPDFGASVNTSHRAQRSAMLVTILVASLGTDLQNKKLFFVTFSLIALQSLWSSYTTQEEDRGGKSEFLDQDELRDSPQNDIPREVS